MELATEPPAMNDQVQLWVMATLAFAVFYSNYMVAPLLSAFSKEFAVPVYQLRWLIAGYLIPYVGLALAGYGLPGIFFGTMIGRWGDRYGRRYVVPFGFLWAAGCAFLLLPHSSRFVAALAITALSVGFDATHPLMSSITTSLDSKHRGQITGFATFANFIGCRSAVLSASGRIRFQHCARYLRIGTDAIRLCSSIRI